MNILFVYERKIIPRNGGVERVTSLLGEEMSRRGHNVHYLSLGLPEWNPDEEQPGSVPQHFISSSEPDFAERAASLLKKIQPDAVIFQGYHATVWPLLPLLTPDVKKLLVFHNQPFALLGKERYIKQATPWNSLRPKGKFFKALALTSPEIFRFLHTPKVAKRYRGLIDSVDGFVLLSERFRNRVVDNIPGVDQAKILAVNNPNTFEIPENYEEDGKENIVLFVGRLSNPQKNVTGFIDVWEKFSDSHPSWKALVVGDGEDRKFIDRYAQKKGINNLTFEGSRSNMEDYYRRSKILCMTSAYEGWPMVLAEAMAYGCVPVVFESFEAVRDIIPRSGRGGILVKPFDARAMAFEMNRLANNEPLRREIAKEGRELISKFTTSNIVSRWEQII